MKTFARLFLGLLVVSGPALAETNIAIIDSGVDYQHTDLQGLIWHDGTTDAAFPDDENGWNFADNNNEVIDYSYLGTFSTDVYKYFDIQGKYILGTATQAEIDWMTAHRGNTDFITQLETFGNFVHGTHVTGIATEGNANARAIPIKMIATKPPQTSLRSLTQPAPRRSDLLIMLTLNFAAKNNLALVKKTASYAARKDAKVGNCSFGASVKALEPNIAAILKQLNGTDPTPEEIRRWTLYLLGKLNDGSEDVMNAAPDMLFVIAAGNDGTNNDADPAWPANVKRGNTITVAASLSTTSLASFSNYGATMVEVAAPGVAINSTIPGNEHIALSGTSMAAPFVTDVAGLVVDINPALTPVEIKQVLVGTVDVKDFLQGKVSSSGIVNRERAVHAAELSKTLSLAAAIAQAKTDIQDITLESGALPSGVTVLPVALPNPIQL